jgi:hypothetical protein
MSRFVQCLGFGFGTAVLLWAQTGSTKPKAFEPKAPPEQPIPFSHKTHVAAAVKCVDCHAMRPPGDAAGFPATHTCMGCHQSIGKGPAIQKLADFAARQVPIPWVRVYRLPRTVYFSHAVHNKQAKVDCAVCHGAVAMTDSLGQEKSIAMKDCMACHDQYKASNDCNLCHDSH